MIKYEKSVEFSGNQDSAVALAKNIFSANDFKINQIDQSVLSVTGPGMQSNRQNLLRGISRGELKFSEAAIEFNGELGGVEFMKKFLCIFPAALGLGLTVLFEVQAYLLKQNLLFSFIPLLAVAPWLFISPFMIKRIQRNTEDAIATALDNISTA